MTKFFDLEIWNKFNLWHDFFTASGNMSCTFGSNILPNSPNPREYGLHTKIEGAHKKSIQFVDHLWILIIMKLWIQSHKPQNFQTPNNYNFHLKAKKIFKAQNYKMVSNKSLRIRSRNSINHKTKISKAFLKCEWFAFVSLLYSYKILYMMHFWTCLILWLWN